MGVRLAAEAAVAMANSHGMRVTLFAMSGRLGLTGYMTASQLRTLQAEGNEIGGHTINHPDLAMLSPAAQRYEICGDRAALEADGLDVTDFAYPYGYFNRYTPGIVQSCGYQSGRIAGGLGARGGCPNPCPPAETIPPRNPYLTRTVNSVLQTTSLATIEHYVTAAERSRGGWVQIVFHYVCDGCDPYSVTEATLDRFVAWLATRARLGTRVETVRQVIQTPAPNAPAMAHLRAVSRHG
jgi:peptidoglycan/xylan/chitin deacetylase (PgdA/CDA1 family)